MKLSAITRLASALTLCLTTALAAGCADSSEAPSGASTDNATAAAAKGAKGADSNASSQQVSTFGGPAKDSVSFQGDAQVRLDQIDLDPGQRLVVTDGKGAKLLDVGSEANGKQPTFTARGGSVRFNLSVGEGGYAATVSSGGGGSGGSVDQATCDRLCGLGVQIAQCAPCP